MTPVIFPDVEATFTTLFRNAISQRGEAYAQGVWVSNAMPKKPDGTPIRKPRMVIIRDDSGTQADAVRDQVRLGVQFWAENKPDASDLAQLGRALLNSLAGNGPVKRVRCVLRPVWVEDAQPMYYSTFEAVIKGTNL